MSPGHFTKEIFFKTLKEIDINGIGKATNISPTFGRSLGGAGNELKGDELVVMKWVMEYMVKSEGSTCFGWLPGYNAFYNTYTDEQKAAIDLEARTFFETARDLGVPVEIHIGDHNLHDHLNLY